MRALVVVLAALLVAPAAAPARTTAVGVGLDEYFVSLGRQKVKPGTVKFNIENVGEDTHDFVIRRGERTLRSSGDIRPGERLTLRIKLRRTVTLFCSIADHEAQGMKARLRVRRR